MKKLIYSILAIVLFVSSFTSCNVDSLEPTLSIEGDINNISTLGDMQGVLYSAYDRLTDDSYYGRDYIIYEEVRSDNCWANGSSGRFLTPAAMTMGNTSGYAGNTWQYIYEVIASCNAIINTEKSSIDGLETELDHIYGQAYAIRALAHFDLLKLYGQQHVTGGTLGVPYIEHFASDINDFTEAEISPLRNTIAENRTNIEDDLATALTLMDATLNDASKQAVSTYAVNALISRVGIYFGDWPAARDAALAVINSEDYDIVDAADLVDYWANDGGSSSIFELAYDGTDNNNINGLQQIYRGDTYGDIQVLDDLYNIFDPGDIRISREMMGTGYYTSVLRNNGKYPSLDYSDNIPLIRYEEVILNYAEALFEINNADPNALLYLNMVPAHRNASPYGAATKANILLERRKELCFEGFRFDDLARTGSDIPEVSPLEQSHGGPAYGSYKYAFPIPQQEIRANGNMVQNDGY